MFNLENIFCFFLFVFSFFMIVKIFLCLSVFIFVCSSISLFVNYIAPMDSLSLFLMYNTPQFMFIFTQSLQEFSIWLIYLSPTWTERMQREIAGISLYCNVHSVRFYSIIGSIIICQKLFHRIHIRQSGKNFKSLPIKILYFQSKLGRNSKFRMFLPFFYILYVQEVSSIYE